MSGATNYKAKLKETPLKKMQRPIRPTNYLLIIVGVPMETLLQI